LKDPRILVPSNTTHSPGRPGETTEEDVDQIRTIKEKPGGRGKLTAQIGKKAEGRATVKNDRRNYLGGQKRGRGAAIRARKDRDWNMASTRLGMAG